MNDRLQTYLRHKTAWEASGWVLLFSVLTAINIATAWWDIARRGLAFGLWEVVTWEVSSNAVWLLTVPCIAWMVERYPPAWERPLRVAGLHLGAALGLSLLHVAGMVGLRKLVYLAAGQRYSFGDLRLELPYEVMKDVRTYAFTAGLVLFYRLALWRWRGEGKLLDAAAPAAPAPAASGHDKMLVKQRGREFLVSFSEVEWVQAEGNYIKLHWAGNDILLRSSLSAFLGQSHHLFERVHRSWLVNPAHVKTLEANEFGDAVIQLASGARVPCSRTYLEAFRKKLGGAGPLSA
ncbi:LytTR family DNA-binding domain-containing protein [Massilia sp. TS11]|uniref:LytR/AlgR family response regulator transcription factor n=1 Tax=Massilia sp. TS11 TaxID=2908003 RepID=UPI001EDAD262|nr:LytTR family DNA-binding domain-containing protein [Massilia sp. TS11]MCG2584942.1 LytTR family transcriptional regulator [Massilia sp. TS11]